MFAWHKYTHLKRFKDGIEQGYQKCSKNQMQRCEEGGVRGDVSP